MDAKSLVRLAEATISTDELRILADWLVEDPQLTKGPLTLEFENRFAKAVGSTHAVFVNSGSSANLLVASAALQSGRLRNNRVLCPAVSWVTSVTPFFQLGFDVELVDADRYNLGLDIVDLEQKIVDFDPAALLLVHVLGHPNHMDQILALCEKYNLMLIEDTCEALGTTTPNGQWLGTLGAAGTFSFYYGHHISTIEGGMVVTDDEDLYQLMLSIRSHGWSRDLSPEARGRLQDAWNIDNFSNLYTFYHDGFNLRPTDLQAKLGLSQLEKLDAIRFARQRNFDIYGNLLKNFWAQESHSTVLSSFAYGTFVENRDELAARLQESGIECRPLLCGNLGRHPFWLKKKPPFAGEVADLVHNFGIYFPNHAMLQDHQIERLCGIVSEVGVPVFPAPRQASL